MTDARALTGRGIEQDLGPISAASAVNLVERFRDPPDARLKRLQRGDQVGEKADQVVVALVQGEPSDP